MCPTLCDPKNHSTPSLPVHRQLPEFTQTHVLWVSDAIQPSHPLSLPSPPAPNSSQHQSLSNESTLSMRWLKYWGFSFSVSPSNEHPGLISLPLGHFKSAAPCSLFNLYYTERRTATHVTFPWFRDAINFKIHCCFLELFFFFEKST